MNYEHGAARCFQRGMCRWRLLADGVEWCPDCRRTRLVDPAVNDLLPTTGLPEHARVELEVDRLNEQRRRRY